MISRKWSISLVLLPLLLLLAAACGDDDPDVVSVQLALDWYPNANHAGLFIAQENGYFADENLEVRARSCRRKTVTVSLFFKACG